MNELQIFESQFGNVRTLSDENGDAWFVGKDVAKALGYSNPRKAMSDHVEDEDRGVTKCDTLGGKQDITIINESGLYSLVLSSKLPTARQFKRWITSEVIPAIRKHGGYLTPEKVEEVLLNPDTIIRLAQSLKEERQLRIAAQAELAKEKPHADYAKEFLEAEGSCTVTSIAKAHGISAQVLNSLLHRWGIQYKQGKQWFLYEKYSDKGYVEVRSNPLPAKTEQQRWFVKQLGHRQESSSLMNY